MNKWHPYIRALKMLDSLTPCLCYQQASRLMSHCYGPQKSIPGPWKCVEEKLLQHQVGQSICRPETGSDVFNFNANCSSWWSTFSWILWSTLAYGVPTVKRKSTMKKWENKSSSFTVKGSNIQVRTYSYSVQRHVVACSWMFWREGSTSLHLDGTGLSVN